MLRANSLKRLTVKRTIRPLYAWHQATPYAAFFDLDTGRNPTALTAFVYPGMVASKTTGELMRIATAATRPFGLFANFINGPMDELGGGTEIGVWRGGPDATFEVLAGPDSSETPLAAPGGGWVALNATAGGVALASDANGRLTNAAVDATNRVARLVEAVSEKKIIITLELGGQV